MQEKNLPAFWESRKVMIWFDTIDLIDTVDNLS